MSDNKLRIYDNIIDQAKSSAGDDPLSCYHLLYGYIKATSLNEAVLKTLYGEEAEQEELKRIQSILQSSGLDLTLAKTALPLMWSNRVLPRADAPSVSGRSPSEILQDVIDRKIPELDLLREGSSLESVLEYIDEHRPESPKKGGTDSPGKKDRDFEEAVREPVSEDAVSGGEEKTEEEKAQMGEEAGYTFAQLVDKTREISLLLQEKVFGQEEAIRMFLEGYFQAEFLRGGETRKRIPVFLYAGPPGVGKTFLAVESAKLLKRPYRKFDMTEYIDPNSEQTFRGSDKNYRNPKEGEVTSFVRENPRAILIFDEVEKAHPDVIHLFLQILDGGVITDSFTQQEVSFRDTLIIFTTNVGKALYEERSASLSSLPTRVVINALMEERRPHTSEPVFPAALCSRFGMGNVVMFNHLTINHLLRITEKEFDETVRALQTAYGYELTYDPELPIVFLFGLGSEMDARTVSARAGRMIGGEIYEMGRHVSNTRALEDVKRIHLQINIEEESEEIRELMTNDEDSLVLIAGDETKWSKVPLDYGCRLEFVGTREEAAAALQEKDYSFVLADPYYHPDEEDPSWLSLDDYPSEGVRIIKGINREFPDVPLYLLETRPIGEEDRQGFQQSGIRGFLTGTDPVLLADEIVDLTRKLFLQRRARDLSGRGRVLVCNTAQRISEDGSEATIRFYDFHITMAVDAGDREGLLTEAERPTERFADVIGAEDAKSELREFIEYMKHPRNFVASGKRPPKGVLLYGPPGTGKTMLARAMAGESDVTFIPTSASAFGNRYHGESERGIRELFRKARSYAPSVIFIDEIDAIGKQRTGGETTHHTESMLNALLTEMDGFKVDLSRPVFVLAATNFDLDGTKSGKSTVLDEALVRRFDNRIYVDLPNKEERKLYVTRSLNAVKHSVTEEAMANVADRTMGQSLAIVKGVLDLALRNAAKASVPLNNEILLNALEEYMYGEKREWTEEYYRSVAIHESGHAYVSYLAGEKPSFVTIVSRGNFGGYMQRSDEETPSYSREDLIWKIRICLAGRAAEICWFGEEKGTNTGISSDLRRATDIALNMICRYGMGKSGFASLPPEELLRTEVGRELLQEANELLRSELDKTMEIVESGREKIDRLAEVLLKENQVMGDEIERLFSTGESS